jgi:hypothetical protein
MDPEGVNGEACATCGGATYRGAEFRRCSGCDRAPTFCNCKVRRRYVPDEEEYAAGHGNGRTDGGPWRGPDLETWVARIARPVLREGETLPLMKPFPAAPAEEETAGAAHGAGSLTWAARPITPANGGWSEAELREIYGK